MHSAAINVSYRPHLAVEVDVCPTSRSKFWCNILSDSPLRRLARGTPIEHEQAMETGSISRRRRGSDGGNDTSGPASGSNSMVTSRKPRSEAAQSSSATVTRTSSSRVPNASGSSKASKSSRPFTTQASYASPENWDMHRAEITTLYLDQDKTLREVKDHMEKTHGFFATWVYLLPHLADPSYG